MERRPWEEANADIVRQACLGIFPFLLLLRYEAIASFYTEEPFLIHIKRDPGGDRETLEQIFRLRRVVANVAIDSWCLFSSECEWRRGRPTAPVVLRRVLWDRAHDRALLEALRAPDMEEPVRAAERERMLHAWPTIRARTVSLSREGSAAAMEGLRQLDRLLRKGVALRKRSSGSVPQWCDVDIRRRWDWGQVQLAWSASLANPAVEEAAAEAERALEACLAYPTETAHEIVLDYTVPPDVYKALVEGETVHVPGSGGNPSKTA